jgi:hypothetical protein
MRAYNDNILRKDIDYIGKKVGILVYSNNSWGMDYITLSAAILPVSMDIGTPAGL